jgi:hypothetical protein
MVLVKLSVQRGCNMVLVKLSVQRGCNMGHWLIQV